VPLLPRAAGTVYVRLWAHVGGAWYFNDFTYTTNVILALTSPAPGSAVNSATANLTWSAVPAADNYALWIGSTVGAYDLYFPTRPAPTSRCLSCPNRGTVYVRLWVHVNGQWYFNDFTYTTTLALALTSPTPGSALTTATANLTWSASTGGGRLRALDREHPRCL